MLTAAELQRRGRDAINRGRFAAARRWSRLALERDPDTDTRVEALLQLAIVAAETDGIAAGRALCAEAAAVRDPSPRVRGHVHARVGLLAMRAGDVPTALVEFEQAEPLLRDDRAALAGMLLNRGGLYLHLRRAEEAARDARRVIEMVGADDPVETAKARHNWGYAELLRGNPVPALRLMEQAAEVLRPISASWAATCDSDRAEVLAACGLHDEAAAALDAAAHAFGTRRLRQPQAEAELARARILLVERPGEAATVARRAARRFRAWGSTDWALRADAVELAARAGAGRTGRAGRARVRELHPVLLERQLHRDAQLLALAGAREEVTRDPDAARDLLRLARVRGADPLLHRLWAREVRARLAVGSGRRRDALEHLRRGVDDLHTWLSEFGSHDLQSSAVGHGRALTALGARLALAAGDPALVFEWAERVRVLSSRVAPVRGEVDLADLARLRHQGDGAEANGGRTSAPGGDSAMRELRARIRQHAWYTPAAGAAARPASLEAVQQALGSRDALVSHLVVDEDLRALVVTDTGASVVELGPMAPLQARTQTLAADLGAVAGELPDSLRAVVEGSVQSSLDWLAEHLVTPVADLAGERRVVLVPSGRLAGVPWAMLPAWRGRPVTVARSATHWLGSRGELPSPLRVGFVRGPHLSYAAQEIALAAESWPGARVDLDATAASTAEIAEGVDVLHVAAHGRHYRDSPMFSGVELHDGPWFGYDIDELDHVPAIVVLSACDVGASTLRAQEYLVGMTTAWLHAGASCVIAAPVPVNDEAAAQLLPAVHVGLAAGSPPGEALAEALAAGDRPAPFACYGRGW